MTLSPGSVFADRYLVQKPIGTVGLAKLFDALDQVTGGEVTLKVVPCGDEIDSSAARRWEREARALQAIDSPHVVRCLDHIGVHGEVGLVTASLHGVDLRSFAALYGPLPIDEVLSLGLQIARGLQACHVAGVVHRDLRPENVNIGEDGTATIANFALAGIEDATTLTMTGTMFGEPEYAAPESFVGAPTDIRIDIYSLGVVLWELMVGESPFQGIGIVQILEEKSSRELTRVSSHNTSIPPWLDDLIARMTARDPDGRPSSLGPVIRGLEQRRRLTAESRSDGQCTACGHRIYRGIDFCSYCGESAVGECDSQEASACIVEAVGDIGATRAFLQRTFKNKPAKTLEKALKKTPFLLVESRSSQQSRWLVKSLEELRCVVDLQSSAQWYFKQTSVVVTLVLSALLMAVADIDAFLSQWTVPDSTVGSAIYLIGKIHFVAVCVLVAFYLVRRCGFRMRDQPQLWAKGAWGFVVRPVGTDHVLQFAGRVMLLLLIAGTMLLSASLLQGLALAVFRMMDIVAYTLSPNGAEMPIVFLVVPVVFTSLFPIGLLLLIVRLVGRIGGPPLYRFESPGEPSGELSWGSEDVDTLSRLRVVSRSTVSDDLRFIVSDTIESYASFVRVRGGMEAGPGHVMREFQEKIRDAVETIVGLAESIVELAESASPHTREALESDILSLRRKVAEESGPAAENASALLRDAEERAVSLEADSELVNRNLNAMRIVSGEIRASVAQLVAVIGDPGDDEGVRRELFQLSETLLALRTSPAKPRDVG